MPQMKFVIQPRSPLLTPFRSLVNFDLRPAAAVIPALILGSTSYRSVSYSTGVHSQRRGIREL